MPYTDYFPFAFGNEKEGIDFSKLNNLLQYDMKVDVCQMADIKMTMFPIKGKVNATNGFFAGVRLLQNNETKE